MSIILLLPKWASHSATDFVVVVVFAFSSPPMASCTLHDIDSMQLRGENGNNKKAIIDWHRCCCCCWQKRSTETAFEQTIEWKQQEKEAILRCCSICKFEWWSFHSITHTDRQCIKRLFLGGEQELCSTAAAATKHPKCHY